ncbi:hypothetical protein [Sigmofec virus UA08Rod_5838]|uniref:Uncharacterized protein n=1 Tax=Sigmofec virus UA08Rod_5838 TaxID=2929442 RepID=A0A976R7A1_9VIRU|nr:hypothetical protein [Sigmofec virus UA08Rod_5838]
MNELKKTTIFTIRYMWKVNGNEQINFKIVSDVEEGHQYFVEQLLKIENLESACSEYLSEIDCSRLCLVSTIKAKENENNA